MASTTAEDRDKIARQLLGNTGQFSAYFGLYDDLSRRDFNQIGLATSPNGPGCDIVLEACELLKRNGHQAQKSDLVRLLQNTHPQANVDSIVNLAVQAMFMIDSAASDWHSSDFIFGGYRPVSWLSHETLVKFANRSFPPTPDMASLKIKVRAAMEQRKAMKAWKLQNRLGLRFRPTNNLAEHLLYDRKKNRLYLFHQVAYLRAQLERFQNKPQPLSMTMEESLQLGSLPPQLLVETLYSLQAVVFPVTDSVSGAILKKLIRKRGFDTECAQYKGYKLFQELPPGFSFVYWGERIAHLHDLLESRPPRNKLERWFQRQSSEGNALFIALLALVISIIVGIVSIVLAAFQAWISWMAWKYPVSPSP